MYARKLNKEIILENFNKEVSISNTVMVPNKHDMNKFNTVYTGRLYLYLVNVGTTYLKLLLGEKFDNFFKKEVDIIDIIKYFTSAGKNFVDVKFSLISLLQTINTTDKNRLLEALNALANSKLQYDNFQEVKQDISKKGEIQKNVANKLSYINISLVSSTYVDEGEVGIQINLLYVIFYNYLLIKYGYSREYLKKIFDIKSKNELLLYLFLFPKIKLNQYSIDLKTLRNYLYFDKNEDNKYVLRLVRNIIKKINNKNLLGKKIKIEVERKKRKITGINFIFLKTLENQEDNNLRQEQNKQNKNNDNGTLFDIPENIDIDDKGRGIIKEKFDNLGVKDILLSDINSLLKKIVETGKSLNDIENIIKSLHSIIDISSKNMILNILDVIIQFKNYNLKLSNEDTIQIISILFPNGRLNGDLDYISNWIRYTMENNEIENKIGYIISIFKKNSEFNIIKNTTASICLKPDDDYLKQFED